MRLLWVPNWLFAATCEVKEDDMLAGRSNLAGPVTNQNFERVGDGSAEQLAYLEKLSYTKYGIDVT